MATLKGFLIGIALLLPTLVMADPDRISILLGSHHVGADGFNEKNPGLFFTWEAGRADWSVGAFHNSYNSTSAAVTVALPFLDWPDGEASIFGGVAYYPGDGRNFAVHAGDLVPIGGLQVRQGHVFAQIVPMDGKPVSALLAFGLTFKLH